MPTRKPSFTISSPPRDDGQLSIVEVSEKECVLSNGEVLYLKWEKSRLLVEQVCQEQVAVWIRSWTTKDGEELIECRRRGETRSEPSTVTTSSSEDAF